MKRILIICILFTSISTKAQNFETLWQDYFSYVSVKDITQGDNKIFAAAENAVFIYDLITQELTTLSSVQGLSGESLTTIHYSAAAELLILGYENGLIEVVNIGQDNEVLRVVDILEKQSIPPNRKRINHFTEYEGLLYISAQFGISEYDLMRLEFGDSYIIGDFGTQINITQTTILEPHIYASSSEGGIRRALIDNDNIIDFEEWETLIPGNFIAAQRLGTRVLVARNDNTVFRINAGNTFEQLESFSSNIVDFGVNNEILTITTTNAIRAYEQGFVLTATANNLPDIDYVLQSGYSFDNFFYMGTTENGILRVPYGQNTFNQILPDGPLFNQPFALDASAGQLWVAFGEVTVSFNPFPLTRRGVSNFKDGSWTNIPHQDIVENLGRQVTDIVDVSIDPANPNSVFFSSFYSGLFNVVDQTPAMLFDETNSSLENPPITINGQTFDQGIRIYGADFDRQNNLWFIQSKVNDGLIRRNPSGQFAKFDITSVTDGEDQLAFSELDTSREGFVFFGAVGTGLIGFNPQNNSFNSISEGDGQGLPSTDIRALAFDNQNRLWIGTLMGLRVVFNPGSFFDGTTPEARPIIFLDGEGVAQELLFEQTITDIEVDGSNNKWIATATSGVFYISATGQETLLRFTDENSPLPSNNVQDIAIDPFTGVVYFATVNGLVAYEGTATAPRNDLEEVFVFPNPVRPGFEGNVTVDGLTENANVKITDLEGNLVFQKTSEGGSVTWDTTAFGRYKVRSGVYFVLITSEDALETKIKKIMIIR